MPLAEKVCKLDLYFFYTKIIVLKVFISGINFIQIYSLLRSQKVKRSCDPHVDGKWVSWHF